VIRKLYTTLVSDSLFKCLGSNLYSNELFEHKRLYKERLEIWDRYYRQNRAELIHRHRSYFDFHMGSLLIDNAIQALHRKIP
jgi:hypothetical protein